MRSSKRRTTSNSGSSGKSPRTGSSPRKSTSSATAPASFEAVFGPNENDTPQVAKLKKQKTKAEATLAEIASQPLPLQRLFRIRHMQTRSRLKRHIEALREAIQALS